MANADGKGRLRAVLRRRREAGAEVLTFGGVELERRGRKVTVQGRTVRLTGREYQLLEILMRQPQALVRVHRIGIEHQCIHRAKSLCDLSKHLFHLRRIADEVQHIVHDLESHADCIAKASGGRSSFGIDSAEQGWRASGQFKQRGGLGSDPVEIFLAVGNPFGLYASMSSGVISGFNRSFQPTNSDASNGVRICSILPNPAARIQEAHIAVGHILCELTDTLLFRDVGKR